MKHTHRIKAHNYYAVSLRFDGLGHGFAVGFDTRTAARAFSLYFLFGFAEVMDYWTFSNRFPHALSDRS